jgi:hypothetical protein
LLDYCVINKGEMIMPKPSDVRLDALPFLWRWPPIPPNPGDPIDMDYLLEEFDPRVRVQLIATRLETLAAVHRNIADGAAKAAEIVAGAKLGQGKGK